MSTILHLTFNSVVNFSYGDFRNLILFTLLKLLDLVFPFTGNFIPLNLAPYVSLFIKELSRKYSKAPSKAYPISYLELSKIFEQVVGDSTLDSLPLVQLRFIAFLVTSYASFTRFEEVSDLKVSNIVREGHGFVLTFQKGKSCALVSQTSASLVTFQA